MHKLYTVAAVGEALQVLKARIPPSQWSDTLLPVIAAPGWWMADVAREFGAAEGDVPHQIHGCPVVRQDDLQAPVLVDHDGSVYRIESSPALQAPAPDTPQ